VTAYESVIGLEVHVQLKTNSKIFCSCPTGFGETANSQICPVCCGYPGVLPVLNKKAVDELVRAALAVGCRSTPGRCSPANNIFIPDLPKNYQISQHDLPLAVNGHLGHSPKIRWKKDRAHSADPFGRRRR
jgi:aspartyl-tRNA(Asn)/glutamyl-tRNA(Gln) amidotransferase subunit B